MERISRRCSCSSRGRHNTREREPPCFDSNSLQYLNLDTSDNSNHPHPYFNRVVLLALLLVPAMAIADAIASGLDSMHAAKQQLAQKHPSLDHNLQGVGKSGLNRSTYAYVEANTPEDESATATVLSRASQLSELISHLDASDVVECYVVTRMAPLANLAVFGVGSTTRGNNGKGKIRTRTMLDDILEFSDANATASNNVGGNTPVISPPLVTPSIPTGPIVIRKSALAFRYRPRVASASHSQAISSEQRTHEKYFELILEYGPQRAGAAKTSESIPIVRMDTDSFGENNNIGKYVSWENEARVYHSTQISKDWTDAYYMASISGVVFEKIIQRAVDYTSKRPRYQPFEVISIPSGNLILRSSDSDDFVWDMFHDLADLYVVIDPLLIPPRDKVQFYVSDPDMGNDNLRGGNLRESGTDTRDGNANIKIDGKQVNPNVQKVKGPIEGSRAAAFYENFFNCANAIRTGDYSSFVPPPSVAPTVPPTASIAPSMVPSMVGENYSINKDDVQSKYTAEFDTEDVNESDGHIDGVQNTTEQLDDSEGRVLSVKFLRYQRLLDEMISNTIDEHAESNLGVIEDASLGDEESLINDADDPAENTTQAADTAAIDDETSTNADNSAEDSNEAAEKAAIEAAEAAENAAAIVATNTSSAADTAAATNEAAKAAQKAKDASVAARSKASAEALLSGDGALMTSVLSSCFSDPKYGIRIKGEIRSDSNNDTTKEWDDNEEIGRGVEIQEMTIAYIYFDGDVFFRLNLTAPYWGTARGLETVPPPQAHPEGHGDAVDWAIFLLILMGTLFGMLVMVHQAGIVVDKRLRFRHFFNPTKKNSGWEYAGLNGENSPLRKGGGFPHSDLFLTAESIPTSMGGEDRSTSPTILHYDELESTSSVNNERELEMAERKFPQLKINDCPVTPPNHSHVLPLSLRMKRFKPDLVERPSSISYTKVAMPQQSPVSTECREVKITEDVSPPPMTT